MSVDLSHLSDDDLQNLHKSLHGDIADSARVEAHHHVTTELLVRGFDHGHENDVWTERAVEVGKSVVVPVSDAFNGIPDDVYAEVMTELGHPSNVSKTVLLTVDGYTIKFDSVAKDAPMNMDDSEPEDMLNETQTSVYEFLETLVETAGKFNKGSGANGAHYMENNPFMSEGLLCGNCVFYQGGQGCEIVEGQIDHMALCKFWVIPENLVGTMTKHGQHDQSSHGNWAGGTMSDQDFNRVHSVLSSRQVRDSYNQGYDSFSEGNTFTTSSDDFESNIAKLRTSTTGSEDVYNQHLADSIVYDAGYFDAKSGAKRKYRRLLINQLPWVSSIPLMKHGQHDQSSHGNWASHSRVTANSAGQSSAEANAEAKRLRDNVVGQEAQITHDFIDVTSSLGGIMEGLEYRMKTEKSMARKIEDDAVAYGGDYKQAADNVSDALRFTMVFETKDYSDGVLLAIETLSDKGYVEDRSKNFWKKGDSYQGVNTKMIAPSGLKIELQFHTPESFQVKEKDSHPLYEKFRVEKDPKKAFKLYKGMVHMFAKVPIPEGVVAIGTVAIQPFIAGDKQFMFKNREV